MGGSLYSRCFLVLSVVLVMKLAAMRRELKLIQYIQYYELPCSSGQWTRVLSGFYTLALVNKLTNGKIGMGH